MLGELLFQKKLYKLNYELWFGKIKLEKIILKNQLSYATYNSKRKYHYCINDLVPNKVF